MQRRNKQGKTIAHLLLLLSQKAYGSDAPGNFVNDHALDALSTLTASMLEIDNEGKPRNGYQATDERSKCKALEDYAVDTLVSQGQPRLASRLSSAVESLNKLSVLDSWTKRRALEMLFCLSPLFDVRQKMGKQTLRTESTKASAGCGTITSQFDEGLSDNFEMFTDENRRLQALATPSPSFTALRGVSPKMTMHASDADVAVTTSDSMRDVERRHVVDPSPKHSVDPTPPFASHSVEFGDHSSPKERCAVVLEKFVFASIPERWLLKDLLYPLQGIGGEYVVYNPVIQTYELRPQIRCSIGVRNLVLDIAQAGTYVRFLTNRLQSVKSSTFGEPQAAANGKGDSFDPIDEPLARIRVSLETALIESKADGRGAVRDLFVRSVWESMLKYFQLLTTCKQKIASDRMTLRQLSLALRGPTERLCLLAEQVDSCLHLHGGELSSMLYIHSQRGEPEGRKFAAKMVEQVTLPIREQALLWAESGKLGDPHGEFFVVDGSSDSDTPYVLWNEGFRKVDSRIPVFISEDLAVKILLTGKSVYFLRRISGFPVVVAPDSPMPNPDPCTSGLEIIRDLESRIWAAANRSNKMLVKVLLEDYKLVQHCATVKRFLLLGQGDFFEHLLDNNELWKSNQSLALHDFRGIVDIAIRNTNAQFIPEECLRRVEVRPRKGKLGDCGFDVIDFDYFVSDSVLEVIISPQCVNRYRAVFDLLWKSKRVLAQLNSTWRPPSNLRPFVASSWLSEFHLMRAEAANFCINVQSYLMYEVVDRSWTKLEAELPQANDVESLIELHNAYLSSIEEGAFMSPIQGAGEAYEQLVKLFDIVVELAKLSASVYQTEARRLLNSRRHKSKGKNTDSDITSGNWETGEADLEELSRLRDRYRAALMEFVGTLRRMQHTDLDDSTSNSLRALQSRLDFNDFYQADREAFFRLLFNSPSQPHASSFVPSPPPIGSAATTSQDIPRKSPRRVGSQPTSSLPRSGSRRE